MVRIESELLEEIIDTLIYYGDPDNWTDIVVGQGDYRKVKFTHDDGGYSLKSNGKKARATLANIYKGKL